MSNLDQIKQLSIVDVARAYGCDVIEQNNRHWVRSPFSQDKTASCNLSADKNLFYCFSTHQGGDLIKFVMLKNGWDFQESIKDLSQKFNIDISTQHFQSSISFPAKLESQIKSKNKVVFCINERKPCQMSLNRDFRLLKRAANMADCLKLISTKAMIKKHGLLPKVVGLANIFSRRTENMKSKVKFIVADSGCIFDFLMSGFF